jgi:hypothetical protein
LVSSRPNKKRTRPAFKFYNVFLAVNAGSRWLNNVSGVYIIKVSLLLIGQQGLVDFFWFCPCFPLAGGLCKFYANVVGKQPIQHKPLLDQYKYQANSLL